MSKQSDMGNSNLFNIFDNKEKDYFECFFLLLSPSPLQRKELPYRKADAGYKICLKPASHPPHSRRNHPSGLWIVSAIYKLLSQ
jgi:hypothetical protein